jgi:two-component system, OmpR family, sensor histidine kinase VicK
MRWWLGLAFAAIAALTALSVAEVFSHRADTALRDRGQALAVGQSVAAAQSISRAIERGDAARATSVIAERHRLSLFVFSRSGHATSPLVSRGVSYRAVPSGTEALRTALHGGRFVDSYKKGKAFVVGLRLTTAGGGAIVTYTPRPDLRQELGIVQSEVIRSALLAVGVGALVGLLVATLIAARLGRIARAAAAIAAGGFDRPLEVRFHDEVGSLGATVDQMRVRLRDSFHSLELERDRLHRLLDSLEEGVIAVDRQFEVVYANEPARELFDPIVVDVGRSLGEPWPDFPLRSFVEDLFAAELRSVVHARVVEANRVYALAGIPAATGTRDAILVVADVSERERRERSEREFVTNAAHELGTPVTAIAASLEALQGGAKDVPGQREQFLELIERQTGRLVRLRRALLMLARVQTGQEAIGLEPIRLRPLLEEVAASLGATVDGEVSFVVDCPDDLMALGREELFEQIVFSLAENALRHSSPTAVTLSGRAGASSVTLEVRDDGSGISPEVRDRVFDRFFQGGDGRGGFGLGLAIVREAVRALGGSVRVESQPGTGTVVRAQFGVVEEAHVG